MKGEKEESRRYVDTLFTPTFIFKTGLLVNSYWVYVVFEGLWWLIFE